MALSRSEFNQLKLPERHKLVHNEGEFIASRQSESYFVHLFSLDGEYVEVWMLIALNQVMWIEIMTNKETLQLYADQFNPKKDLGL